MENSNETKEQKDSKFIFFLHNKAILPKRCQFATLLFVYIKTNWKKINSLLLLTPLHFKKTVALCFNKKKAKVGQFFKKDREWHLKLRKTVIKSNKKGNEQYDPVFGRFRPDRRYNVNQVHIEPKLKKSICLF